MVVNKVYGNFLFEGEDICYTSGITDDVIGHPSWVNVEKIWGD